VRDTTTDATVKTNAQKTLFILKNFH